MLKIEATTEYFVGRDDGTNFGPFESAEKALEWATRELTNEEVLSQYRDEALELVDEITKEYNEPGTPTVMLHIDYLHARMLDLIQSADWILFNVTVWGGDASAVLDEDEMVSPHNTEVQL